MPALRSTRRSSLSPGSIFLVAWSIPLPSILRACVTLPEFTALKTYVPGLSRVISAGSNLISVSFTWIVWIGPSETVDSPADTAIGVVASTVVSPTVASTVAFPCLSVSASPPQPARTPKKSKQIHPAMACLSFIKVTSSFPFSILHAERGRDALVVSPKALCRQRQPPPGRKLCDDLPPTLDAGSWLRQ